MKIFTEASGSLVSVAIIKHLKDAGLYVVASDITNNNAGGLLADDYLKVPKVDHDNLWFLMKDIIIKNKIDWILPSFDEMLLGWSSAEMDIKFNSAEILISPHKTIKMFTDKWNTFNAFVNAGLPTPKTSLEKRYQMVKPRKGRGSQGIIITDDLNVDMQGMISQEIVNGTELTIDCLFGLDGTPIYIVPRLRLKVVNGKSVNAQTIKNGRVEKYIIQLANKYHFIGPINVQCFIKNKSIWFIEVNPRIGGGMALGFAATENWFDLWFNKIIKGKMFKPKPVKYGLQMYRHYSEVFKIEDEV